jgi:hypothetical protein
VFALKNGIKLRMIQYLKCNSAQGKKNAVSHRPACCLVLMVIITENCNAVDLTENCNH